MTAHTLRFFISSARAHRKQHSLLDGGRGSTWWAPDAVGWWIGVLFGVGSICFALGAMPGYVEAVGVATDGVTFFVGSLFFTSAALLQYLEVVNTERGPRPDGTPERRRLLTFEPHRMDWWASSVQLVGTLFFNVSTGAAMIQHLSASEANQFVWKPNVYGCICFLVASAIAWIEVSHRWFSWRPRELSWWIAGANLAGSIAFAVSAAAAKIVSSTDQARNVTLMNLGTFIGALGFLTGAVLLLPERTLPVADA
jgi:YrhK-like protein